MSFLHGDVRFYNNIFVQRPVLPLFHEVQNSVEKAEDPNARMWDTMNFDVGTFVYDDYPTEEEWKKQFEGYCGMGSDNPYPNKYYSHLPVWAEGNLYLGGAKPWRKEAHAVVKDDFVPELTLEEREDGLHLATNLGNVAANIQDGIVSTAALGMAFEPEERFENPDGSEIIFNQDYFGEHRKAAAMPGPFASEEDWNRAL